MLKRHNVSESVFTWIDRNDYVQSLVEQDDEVFLDALEYVDGGGDRVRINLDTERAKGRCFF
jgi:hypothetical protein